MQNTVSRANTIKMAAPWSAGLGPIVLTALSLLTLLVITDACQFGPKCTFPCHCNEGADCDPDTGHCGGAGCDDGISAQDPEVFSGQWYGPGCQIGNVAHMKSAYQSGGWVETGTDFIHTADLAVNGKISQGIMGTKNCAIPDVPSGKFKGWWVDLGSEHVIYNMTILARDYPRRHVRLWETTITVGNKASVSDNAECAYISEKDRDYDEAKVQFGKQCSQPMKGQYVGIFRYDGDSRFTICEIYIEGYKYHECPSGQFGPGCLSPCNCQTDCDKVSGICPANCVDGWLGPDCQISTSSPHGRLVSFNVKNSEKCISNIIVAVAIIIPLMLILVIMAICLGKMHQQLKTYKEGGGANRNPNVLGHPPPYYPPQHNVQPPLASSENKTFVNDGQPHI